MIKKRIFSKIKHLQRLKMAQERLSKWALMNIGNDVLNNVDLASVFEKIVSKKVRKANIWILIVVGLCKNEFNIKVFFVFFYFLFENITGGLTLPSANLTLNPILSTLLDM